MRSPHLYPSDDPAVGPEHPPAAPFPASPRRRDRHIGRGATVRFAALGLLLAVRTGAIAATEPLPSERWAGIFLDGSRIGYAFYDLRRAPDGDGYLVESRFRLKVLLMGEVRAIDQTTHVRVDPSFRLEDFRIVFESGASGFRGSGRAVAPGRIQFRIETGDGATEREIVAPEDVLLDDTVEAFLGLNLGRIADRSVLHTFEPVSGLLDSVLVEKSSPETLSTGDSAVAARPLRLTTSSGQSKLWLSDSGDFLKETGPLGFEVLAETMENALRGIESDPRVDFLRAFAVEPDRQIPRPRSLKRLRIRLEGLDSLDWIPVGGRQRWIDREQGLLEILAGDVDLDPPASEDNPAPYRLPEPFIQSDDPRIIERAELIAAGALDDRRKVERVVQWVHHSLAREPTVSLPSAIDVLREKKGDCNEHTILTVALLRSLGIAARQAVGLVYESGLFYYHAWPEVYLDGWRGIEPTFGWLWADATHVKLAQGGPDRQANLLRAMNRLRIKIVLME